LLNEGEFKGFKDREMPLECFFVQKESPPYLALETK